MPIHMNIAVVVALVNGEREGDLGDTFDAIILATMHVIVLKNKGSRKTDCLEQ